MYKRTSSKVCRALSNDISPTEVWAARRSSHNCKYHITKFHYGVIYLQEEQHISKNSRCTYSRVLEFEQMHISKLKPTAKIITSYPLTVEAKKTR